MKGKTRRIASTLLAVMMFFSLLAGMSLTAIAEGDSFNVTKHPVGATYNLNATAVPITASFLYEYVQGQGWLAPQSKITVQWYWSSENSNTGRANGFGEEEYDYHRIVEIDTALTPATDTVGVKYYYAVFSYTEITNNAGDDFAEDKEKATDPARIEVIDGGFGFRVRKTDENGNNLSGAVIQLVPDSNYDQEESVISYEETTVDGYASFTVGMGYYILSEKQAPEGYNISGDKHYINVNQSGVFLYTPGTNHYEQYELVTFINKPIPQLPKDDHKEYMEGYPGDRFLPMRPMTRAEAVVMFFRLHSGKMEADDCWHPYYPDMPSTRWYANEVSYMHNLGVLNDFSRDGRFRGDNPVTRAEFATLASHFDNLTYTDVNNFPDVPNDHWAVKYINSAAAKGWILGFGDGTFRPEGNMIRQDVVRLVNRMLERKGDAAFLDANPTLIPINYVDVPRSLGAYLDIMEASTSHSYIRDGAGDEHWTSIP